MQTRRFTHLPSLVLAVLCTLLVGSVAAEPRTIVGTWNITGMLPECTEACPCPGGRPNIPIHGMHQYQPHGALLEIGSSGIRGPGVGSWDYVGKHQFVAHYKFFIFNPDGSPRGSEEVTNHIRLTGPDEFEAAGTFDLFDPTGKRTSPRRDAPSTQMGSVLTR